MWINSSLRVDIPFVWRLSEERFELLGPLPPPIPGALLIRQSLVSLVQLTFKFELFSVCLFVCLFVCFCRCCFKESL